LKSIERGGSTLAAEVLGISALGVSIRIDGRELHLPFKQFPWFLTATVAEVLNLERPASDHLRWPDLDVDLELDSILHPERYPLISRELLLRSGQASARYPNPSRTSRRKSSRR
jgi:hypothetical protein